MTKERRKDIRVDLISESLNLFKSDGTGYHVKIKNISNGGVYLEEIVLRPNEHCVLSMSLPGDLGKLDLSAKVKRVDWASTKAKKVGSVLVFYDVSEGNKRILEAYITYLRNKQIITVSKRIIEEFFGKRPPL